MWTVPQVLVRVSGCWLGCFQHQCITFPKGNAGNAKVMPCLLQRVHLLIYALSAFDDAILGFNKTSKWVETSVYFTWGSVLVCIVFVVVNFFMHFSSRTLGKHRRSLRQILMGSGRVAVLRKYCPVVVMMMSFICSFRNKNDHTRQCQK